MIEECNGRFFFFKCRIGQVPFSTCVRDRGLLKDICYKQEALGLSAVVDCWWGETGVWSLVFIDGRF